MENDKAIEIGSPESVLEFALDWNGKPTDVIRWKNGQQPPNWNGDPMDVLP